MRTGGYLPEGSSPGKRKSWVCLGGLLCSLLFCHFQRVTSKRPGHQPPTPYPLTLHPQISGGCSDDVQLQSLGRWGHPVLASLPPPPPPPGLARVLLGPFLSGWEMLDNGLEGVQLGCSLPEPSSCF